MEAGEVEAMSGLLSTAILSLAIGAVIGWLVGSPEDIASGRLRIVGTAAAVLLSLYCRVSSTCHSGKCDAIHYHHHRDYHVAMTSRQDAIASLAEDVGRALVAFAEHLREDDTSTPPPGAAATPGRALGRSQQKVLDAVAASAETGLTAAEVAAETDIASTNTPRILKALSDRGLVFASGESPAVWRTEQIRSS